MVVFKVQVLRRIQEQFFPIYNEVLGDVDQDGATLDIRDVAKEYTFGVTRDTLFGLDKSSNVQMDMSAMDGVMELINECLRSNYKSYLYRYYRPKRLDPVRRIIETVSSIIRTKFRLIKEYEENGTEYESKDILDLLLAHTLGEDAFLSVNDLLGQIFILALAGTETTSNIIACLVYTIGQREDIQEKIYQEILENDITEPTWDQLDKLTYTMSTALEALRYFNTAGFFGRDVLEDIDLGDDRVIPAGVRVTFLTTHVHFNEDYWPDPYAFNPDRFNKENYTPRQRKAFFPFGWGERLCIGNLMAKMEIVTFLYALISKYRIVSAPEPIEMMEKFTTQPKNPLNVTFHKRDI